MSDNPYEVTRGERPAVAAPPDLKARYETDTGTYGTLRIYAFSAEGHPLVLEPGDTRLVRPEVAETKMTAPLGDAWQLAGFMLFSFMTNIGPNAMTYLIAGEVFPIFPRRRGGLRRVVRQDRCGQPCRVRRKETPLIECPNGHCRRHARFGTVMRCPSSNCHSPALFRRRVCRAWSNPIRKTSPRLYLTI